MAVLAARLHVHGCAPVVESLPEPVAGADEVVVDMVAASLNPVDLRVRDGAVGAEAPLPRTVGIEGVGYQEGRLVLVSGAGIGLTRNGTLARRMLVAPEVLIDVPRGVAPDQAACCGVAGATAVRVVSLADLQPDDRPLVLGASGAVGQAICRLLSGRSVVGFGQTRSAEREAAVADAGAEPVVASDPDALARILDQVSPAVVFDGLGGAWTAAAIAHAAPRSRIVLFGGTAGGATTFDGVSFYRKSASMRGYSGMSEDPKLLRGAMSEALDAVASGLLRFPIATRLSLEQVADGYDLLASGAHGKLVVALDGGAADRVTARA